MNCVDFCSREKSNFDQAIGEFDQEQEVDHEQYDSFKAQVDDSHYIDHNDDETDAFNLERYTILSVALFYLVFLVRANL